MLAGLRHHAILAFVRRHGGARHHELIRALGVSDATIRRDLTALEERGELRRVHGGAMPIETIRPVLTEPARPDPAGIALAAAALVAPAATIAVSAGPHMLHLAKALSAVPDLTVVTTSLPVASALQGAPHREHIIAGGISTPGGQVGALALATILPLHVDLLFLAVHGMHAGGGYTAVSLPEAETGRALVQAARQIIVLADHTTWGRVGAAAIARLDQAAIVISDNDLPADARTVLSAQVGRLIVVDRRTARSTATDKRAAHPDGRTTHVPPQSPHGDRR